MATSNERIFDGLTRRQIGLLRLAAGIGREAETLIRDSNPQLREFLRGSIERLGAPTRPRRPAATLARLKSIERAWVKRAHPAFVEAAALYRKRFAEVAIDEAQFIDRLLTRTLPVVVSVSLPDAATLRSLVSNSIIEGAPLREWFRDWERNDIRRVVAQIRVGVLAGETADQVTRRVFGTTRASGFDGIRQITQRGAGLITRTALSSIASESREQVYRQNQDIVEAIIYRATLDSSTTPICRALDGKRFEVGKGPRPPQHGNCRSTSIPVIDGAPLGNRPAVPLRRNELAGLSREARRRRVRELVGPVPASTTYGQWLRRQPAAFQNEVLGQSRGRLFRSGKLGLDQFVDLRTGRQLTLKELNSKYDL